MEEGGRTGVLFGPRPQEGRGGDSWKRVGDCSGSSCSGSSSNSSSSKSGASSRGRSGRNSNSLSSNPTDSSNNVSSRRRGQVVEREALREERGAADAQR